jgi:hypothetical protein
MGTLIFTSQNLEKQAFFCIFATFFTLTNGDFPVKGDSGTGPE